MIEKIKLLTSDTVTSEFERILRIEYAQGKIDLGTMKRLLAAYKEASS